MTYNAANQLVSLNGQTWQHDLDGNVVVRRVGNATWELGYDAEGNLVSLQKEQDSGVGWVYEYDGLGRRVRGVRGSLEVVYLYSGDTLVAEGSGKVAATRFSGYTTATAARCISRLRVVRWNTSTGTCGATWRRPAARQARVRPPRSPMRLATR